MVKTIDLRPRKIIPRMGFIIQDPVVLHHYEAILDRLDKDELELILHQPQRHPELASWAAKFPFRVRNSSELLTLRQGYQTLVSNHYIGLLSPIPYAGYAPRASASLIRLLGQTNIRFMYGLGAERWNLAEWNGYYDHFLCQGPLQAQDLAIFKGKTWQMGYPRYDRLLTEPIDRLEWLKKLGCIPDRPVLLYLPTLKAYGGTLRIYADFFASLSPQIQVIVKPHPLAWQEESEDLEALSSLPFTALIRENIDNLALLQIADFVACDYGGSAFSALYTDKNIILLDRPGYFEQQGKSEALLRQTISTLTPQNIQSLPTLLKNQHHWQTQSDQRSILRTAFFAPYQGHATERAVKILRKIFQSPPS